MPKKRGPGRPRGSKNRFPRRNLAKEGASTEKPGPSSGVQKKRSVRSQSVASSGENRAGNLRRRALTKSDGDNPRARVQTSPPGDEDHGNVQAPLRPRPGNSPALLTAPGVQGLSQGSDSPAHADDTGGESPGPYPQGSRPQGLVYPANVQCPPSQPRVSYPTGLLAAPCTSHGSDAQGLSFAGGGLTSASYHEGLPPSARGFTPQASPPQLSAYGSLATGHHDHDHDHDRSRSSLVPREHVPDHAELSPQPANNYHEGTDDGLREGGDPAQAPAQAPEQDDQGGAGELQAMRVARNARHLGPIVRLKGQTLFIKSLDYIFEDWPVSRVNDRMEPFLFEVKNTNSRLAIEIGYAVWI